MRYLVYRHGSNRSNQSADQVPVAIVEADSAEAAIETECDPKPSVWTPQWLRLAPHIKAWANQYFTAVPETQANTSDWNAVLSDWYNYDD